MAERSNRVNNAIKECYARLATIHFAAAAKVIGTYTSSSSLMESKPPEITALDERHMERVEKYLTRAGADATRWYFNAIVPRRD